jgi:hypothetical protein
MRRQRLTARGSERFKNYGSVLQQHEQEKKMKRIVKVFGFFLVIAVLIIIYLVVQRWESKRIKKNKTTFVSEQKISPYK